MGNLPEFWDNVRVDASGCWLWTGKLRHGRPEWSGDGAHREAYRRTHGPIPDLFPRRKVKTAYICHSCDVKLCVNPDHLYAGTAKANAEDAMRNGRVSRPWLGKPRNFTPQALANISAAAKLGHPSKPETNRKISAARKGRPLSEAHRRSLSVARQRYLATHPKTEERNA